jgi:hypothetical protein
MEKTTKLRYGFSEKRYLQIFKICMKNEHGIVTSIRKNERVSASELLNNKGRCNGTLDFAQ